jgi:protocatechuate 3,4-dioxygenase beta subunit
MKNKDLSRRRFLKTALAAGATSTAGAAALDPAAAQTGAPPAPPKDPPKYSDYVKDLNKGGETETPTEGNIEGPFYRPGVPERSQLYRDGDKGDVLVISGTIVNRKGQPINGAVMEIWQVDADGVYDNGDPDHPPANDVFHMRGRVTTKKDGRYQFTTLRPAHYPITPTQFRTAHIHFHVKAKGYRMLTSQFFLPGEKYNRTDPWFKPSMVLDLKPVDDHFETTFKIVLDWA